MFCRIAHKKLCMESNIATMRAMHNSAFQQSPQAAYLARQQILEKSTKQSA